MARDSTDTKVEAVEGAPRLDWLEEERRRDKATLTDLRNRQEQYEAQLAHVQSTLEGIEERLTQITSEVSSVTRFDKALQQFKDEILIELRRSEERLGKDAEERDKRQREETQQRLSAVTRLEQRIAEAMKLEDALQTHRVETERLHKASSALQLQIDDAIKQIKGQHERLLAFGERVGKTEARVAEILQAHEEESSLSGGLREGLRLVQVGLERADKGRSSLESQVTQVSQEQGEIREALRKSEDRGKKRIAGWTKEMTDWRKDEESLRAQIAIAGKQARDGDRMLSALEAMRIQLEKDRDSIQHMERTAEERQKQQIEDWRKENELLWLRSDERWDQQARENAKRDEHIARLWEAHLTYLRRQVAELEKLIKGLDKRLMRPNR